MLTNSPQPLRKRSAPRSLRDPILITAKTFFDREKFTDRAVKELHSFTRMMPLGQQNLMYF